MEFEDLYEMVNNKSFHKALTLWAADCAERVLGHFEEYAEHDARPRNAIEAARAWVKAEIKVTEARKAAFAAHAAAREAVNISAIAAARSAAHAAATAHVASHSIQAVNYAHKAIGLLKDTEDLKSIERDWQLWHLQKIKASCP